MKKFQLLLRVVVVVELRYSEIFGRTKFENLDFLNVLECWSNTIDLSHTLWNHPYQIISQISYWIIRDYPRLQLDHNFRSVFRKMVFRFRAQNSPKIRFKSNLA